MVQDIVRVTKRTETPQRQDAQRVSVTFPSDHYQELKLIAERKRVSVAWVVRDAVENYLAAELPLFRQPPAER